MLVGSYSGVNQILKSPPVLRAPAGRPRMRCRSGPEKKSILQKTNLMFSITYGRKNAGFSIFSHDLGLDDVPASPAASLLASEVAALGAYVTVITQGST